MIAFTEFLQHIPHSSALIILLYLVLINLITFLIYGRDKWRARRSEWRTPEATLLILAAAGGSIGALTAMYYFHHKTRKKAFKYGVPTILILQLLLAALLIVSASEIVFL